MNKLIIHKLVIVIETAIHINIIHTTVTPTDCEDTGGLNQVAMLTEKAGARQDILVRQGVWQFPLDNETVDIIITGRSV
ncbi:MAG: hypothetical protein EBR93_05420, partial [Bacteroidetes bacterium]|nr:hypothetical protein [Bacteroidota bacterium]